MRVLFRLPVRPQSGEYVSFLSFLWPEKPQKGTSFLHQPVLQQWQKQLLLNFRFEDSGQVLGFGLDYRVGLSRKYYGSRLLPPTKKKIHASALFRHFGQPRYFRYFGVSSCELAIIISQFKLLRSDKRLIGIKLRG